MATLKDIKPALAELLEHYDAYLRDNGKGIAVGTPNHVLECSQDKFYPGGKLSYVRLMIQRMLTEADIFKNQAIPNFIEPPYDDAKIYAWMGFIQGVLWSEGMEGISDLRNQTKRAKENREPRVCAHDQPIPGPCTDCGAP